MASATCLVAFAAAAVISPPGVDAVAMHADNFLETDQAFGEANPLAGIADRTIQAALQPHLEGGRVPIVTGFCGRAA